jgi:putative intracellular protease/amidase
MKTKRALIICTSHSDFKHPKADPTGLWLSELTHFYDVFEQTGISMEIVSIKGGDIPIDQRGFNKMVLDKATKKRSEDKEFMNLLKNTKSIEEINPNDFDLLYFAGGHGAMWDFVDNDKLDSITREMYESNKIVAAVCHGVAALQNIKLSNGNYLISGKKGTGFAFFDETLAGVKKFVPYNLQNRLKERGMKYSKAFFPLSKHTVQDGLLFTGQNPNSATELAQKVLAAFKKN